jgi:LPXTG-motif cell wall-anchored protein
MSIQPKGAPTLPTTSSGGLMPSTSAVAAQAAANPTAADKSFPLDALLQTGLTVAATVGGIRAQTGATATRQQRIAACGRRPLLSRRKKEAYQKCVDQLQGGGFDNRNVFVPPPAAPQSNTMTIVLIGLGVLLVGGVTIFLLRRK